MGRGSSKGGGGGGVPELIPDPNGGGNANKEPFSNTGVGMRELPTLKSALGTKSAAKSMDDATMNSNPYYDGRYREFSENCQRAVIAYEARRRGYDVTAQPTFEGDILPTTAHIGPNGERNARWMGAFQGARPINVGKSTAKATQKAVEDQMKQYGNGSRAILQVAWKGTGGHVINVENRNGRIYYNDAQVHGRYNGSALFNAIKTGATNLVRVDNLKFSERAKKSVEPADRRK